MDFVRKLLRVLSLTGCFFYLILQSLSAAAADRVEVEVIDFNQQIYLSVGEAPPFVLQPEQEGETVDISFLFASGSNTLRVRAFNTGIKSTGFALNILQNGTVIAQVSCSSDHSPCDSNAGTVAAQLPRPDPNNLDFDITVREDLYFDQNYSITLAEGLARQNLTVSFDGLEENESGFIYLNHFYTDYTLADQHVFSLPQGSYTLGLGVFSEESALLPGLINNGGQLTNVDIDNKTYAGRYYETTVDLSSDSVLDLSGLSPLGIQNETSIVIVPVKNTVAYDKDNVFLGDFLLD